MAPQVSQGQAQLQDPRGVTHPSQPPAAVSSPDQDITIGQAGSAKYSQKQAGSQPPTSSSEQAAKAQDGPSPIREHGEETRVYVEGSQPPQSSIQTVSEGPAVVGGTRVDMQGIKHEKDQGGLANDPRQATYGIENDGPSATEIGEQIVQGFKPKPSDDFSGMPGREGHQKYQEPSQPPEVSRAEIDQVPKLVGGHALDKDTVDNSSTKAEQFQENKALSKPDKETGEAVSAVMPSSEEDPKSAAKKDLTTATSNNNLQAIPSMNRISEERTSNLEGRSAQDSVKAEPSMRAEIAHKHVHSLLGNSLTAKHGGPMSSPPKGLGQGQGES